MIASIPSIKKLQEVFGSKAGEARKILEMKRNELIDYAEMMGMGRLDNLKLHEVRMDVLDQLSGESSEIGRAHV